MPVPDAKSFPSIALLVNANSFSQASKCSVTGMLESVREGMSAFPTYHSTWCYSWENSESSCMKRKIYVASSWRNEYYPEVVERLLQEFGVF